MIVQRKSILDKKKKKLPRFWQYVYYLTGFGSIDIEYNITRHGVKTRIGRHFSFFVFENVFDYFRVVRFYTLFINGVST